MPNEIRLRAWMAIGRQQVKRSEIHLSISLDGDAAAVCCHTPIQLISSPKVPAVPYST